MYLKKGEIKIEACTITGHCILYTYLQSVTEQDLTYKITFVLISVFKFFIIVKIGVFELFTFV